MSDDERVTGPGLHPLVGGFGDAEIYDRGRHLYGAEVAEEIPLEAASVEAVLAADAFHWFDESRAMPEIRRVLRGGGGVAILRTGPVLDESWGQELGAIITEARPEHPAFSPRPAAAALEEDPAFGPVSHRQLTSRASFDRERMLAYVASFSWVGSLSERERSDLLGRVDELLDGHGIAEVDHAVLHQIWVARLL